MARGRIAPDAYLDFPEPLPDPDFFSLVFGVSAFLLSLLPESDFLPFESFESDFGSAAFFSASADFLYPSLR